VGRFRELAGHLEGCQVRKINRWSWTVGCNEGRARTKRSILENERGKDLF